MGCGANDGEGLVIVHDQFGELGGSERVLAAIAERFPAAEIVAPSFAGPDSSVRLPPGLENRVRIAWKGGRRRHFLAPLYARRIARVPLDGARVVLSTAGTGWSLAARVPSGAVHVAYSAGLPRLFAGDAAKYLPDYPGPLRPLLSGSVPLLRAQFGRLIRRPDRLLTNSAWSAKALEHAFGVSAEVIHPPVRTSFFTPARRPRRHALVVARLVPHKRVDVVIEAFRGLDDQLVVAGGGPWLEPLRAASPPNVRFTGYVTDEELRELYRTSVALIHPSVEEFGIAMAEAQACGVPVVAPRAGGALEIVRDNETGILLGDREPAAIATAFHRLRSRPPSPQACRDASLGFSVERFVAEIDRVLVPDLERSLAQERREALPVALSVPAERQLPDTGTA